MEGWKHHEDEAGEAIEIVGEQPGAALGTEIAAESLAGIGDVVARFRIAADQGEVVLRHGKEGGRLLETGLWPSCDVLLPRELSARNEALVSARG